LPFSSSIPSENGSKFSLNGPKFSLKRKIFAEFELYPKPLENLNEQRWSVPPGRASPLDFFPPPNYVKGKRQGRKKPRSGTPQK
jgi:hypothetical protein